MGIFVEVFSRGRRRGDCKMNLIAGKFVHKKRKRETFASSKVIK